ncbi:MAG TPA: Crp/Fnr family transcriptional regulator [Gemmatimonadaceae bacterium]|jgi:CRP-like cAMP-binding protein
MYDSVQIPTTDQTLTGNRLLDSLPSAELNLLRSHTELGSLNRHETLYEPGSTITTIHFPVDGIVSLVCMMKDGGGVETATIGREGIVGGGVFHGVFTATQQAIVQVPGQSYRLSAEKFVELLPQLPTLSMLLHRFSVLMFTLAAQNSGCNRKHSIEERCCRWMLMVADRLDRETFELTHDFIAQMLGVRRASVTEALGALEKRGLIKTSRGRITLTDRPGLEAAVCECYAVIRGAVARLFDGDNEPKRAPV